MPSPLLSVRSFREEISEYDRWLRGALEPAGLSWRQVAVIERPVGTPDGWIAGSEIDDLQAYEARFSEVLAAAAGWVNLEAVTIHNDRVIVSIVWREASAEEQSAPVSVNYSGFDAEEAERLVVAATSDLFDRAALLIGNNPFPLTPRG